ncbi:uncharacterized protein [Prorops nasuta]|uniref:uncharacterized protein n=1 Tax=Prorops nasuta TaxID=863751 RepID=UPI0034CEAC4D
MSLTLKSQIRKVIRRFKFEELKKAVLPIFPEITWKSLRKSLITNHEAFTVNNALNFIEYILDESNIRNKDLKERLLILELIDISRHYKRKIWYTHLLEKSDDNNEYMSIKEIEHNLMENLQITSKKMHIRIARDDNITFISVIEKKRKTAPIKSTYFALFFEYRCLFCTKNNLDKDVLKAIVNSIGYTNIKPNKLIGRDLKSLVQMVQSKRQGAMNAEQILEPAKYTDAEPVIKASGIDFSQVEQRKKYAERCFGKNAPKIECFIVDCPHQLWVNKKHLSKLSNEKVYMGWEFHSPDAVAFLKKLIELCIFSTPLPHYASQMMTQGKTEFLLQ